MKAGMAQPALDGRGLVSAVIVQDQMQLQQTRHVSVDGFQKAAKLVRAIAPIKLANHGAPADATHWSTRAMAPRVAR